MTETPDPHNRSTDGTRPEAPPWPKTPAGETRRVGVEIEFAGLDVPRSAALVRDLFGGTVEEEDPHRLIVAGGEFGDFTVELDASIVHGGDEEGPDTDGDAKPVIPREVEAGMREALGKAVTGIVPVEIVSPPMPWDSLGRLNALTDGLRERGGKGTRDNPLYGFGLHLNPEVASTEVADLLAQFRAYLILAAWLRAQARVDMTRRLLPHIDPFPREYVIHVLDPDYAPDQTELIIDYLRANPTRNRELDLLPLFRHLDETLVMDRLDDPLIKARPTFHYRLPNCNLDDPDWAPVDEWNRWVRVEELAADAGRLAELGLAYRRRLQRPAPARWLDEIRGWFEE